MDPRKKLSANTEFFVALTMIGEHSFITLGAHDHSDGKTHVLGYIGKKLRDPKDYKSAGRCKSVFSTCQGVLTQDYKFKTIAKPGKPLDFLYKAYTITRDDYLHFIRETRLLLDGKYSNFTEKEKEEFKVTGYYPTQEDPTTFQLRDLNDLEVSPDETSHYRGATIEELNFRNNCRHTARSMLRSFTPDGNRLLDGISNYAYQNMPFSASYQKEHDQIAGPFYILPTPPDLKDANKTRKNVLIELYKKLESIPKLNPDLEATKKKFAAVKSLYNELNTAPAATAWQIFNRIQTWEKTNEKLIDQKRSFALPFFKTSTRVLIEDLKNNLSQVGVKYPLMKSKHWHYK